MMSDGSKPARSVSSRYARWQIETFRSIVSAWPCLVERHHDDAGAVAPDDRGLLQEVLLAFLQADRN